MNFERAECYLAGTINEQLSRREPYRLDRMRALLRQLGDPQTAYPTLHIGGTSGKGSTATMVAAILQADGKRVGLHTKPHVRSITERARIDGIDIPQERFAELLEEMMPAIERVAQTERRPSYYETVLALAFLYFARERVDVAVIEVGIGGKLDGTNVIVPEVSVITSVGFDHMDVLGYTLEEIAADKAGIAKPGVPLVSAVADTGARRVIEERCAQVGAPFISVLDTATITSGTENLTEQRFRVTTPLRTYDISLPVLGRFQRTNAATAIRAIELMRSKRVGAVSAEAIERALAHVRIAGRMEYIAAHPSVIFDIAHNPEKAQSVRQAIDEYFPGKHVLFVIAIGESKDAREILRAIQREKSSYIFTTFHAVGKHATPPQKLAGLMSDVGGWGRAIADPVEALAIARREAGGDDLVVVTGSTFIVAELRDWYLENVASVRAL